MTSLVELVWDQLSVVNPFITAAITLVVALCCISLSDYLHSQRCSSTSKVHVNPSLAEHDMSCLSKQCRSRSVGF